MTISTIEQICLAHGLKMTPQRKLIAKVLVDATDHPDIEELYRRAHKLDSKISLATVYRTMNMLEACGAVQKLQIKDNKARYEPANIAGGAARHHHHLIDIDTGDIVEFYDQTLEDLKVSIANKLGYELIDHRLELYGAKLKKNK